MHVHCTCTFCLSSDHSTGDCALASLEPPGRTCQPQPTNRTGHGYQGSYPPWRSNAGRQRPYSIPPTTPRTNRSNAWASDDNICGRFNRGLCSSSAANCRFEHLCSNCQQSGHSLLECRRERRREGVAPPTVGPASTSGTVHISGTR